LTVSKISVGERILRKYRHLIEESGEYLMSGNDAVARGAIEAGIKIATSYPGTPASDILGAIAAVARYHGIYAEWSVNEKVAFEVAYATALSGLRALVSTKHLGMNVLSDSLLVSAYTGVNGGLVLVTVDDIHPWSSQNAEDTRYYARLAKIPCLEPSSPSEAKEVVKYAFNLSEELKLPVIVRYTEKIATNKEIVKLGNIDFEARRREAKFYPDHERYVMIAPHTRKNHPILNKKLDRAMEIFEKSSLNTVLGPMYVDIGIIVTGVSYQHAMEAISLLNMTEKIRVLKIVTSNPPPQKLIADFLETVNKVLVLEEIEPILEKDVKEIAQSIKRSIDIYGRLTGYIPREYELTPDIIIKALKEILGEHEENKAIAPKDVIPRIPSLCAGCPHRISYLAIKTALRRLRKRGIVVGDRGCYNQGVHPPLRAIDTCVAMGASVGMACGFYKANIKEPIVAVIGDSTFFHAGISPLIDAVYNSANITVVVLDNEVTAMTGHQPNPSSGRTVLGEKSKKIYPEKVAEALGIEFIRVVDTSDFEYLVRTLIDAIEYNGVSVVVIRSPCILEVLRSGKKTSRYEILQDLCIKCYACVNITGCPAIVVDLEGKVTIDPYGCTGCGICAEFCPKNAIVKVD